MEVLICAGLIVLTIGSVITMNARSASALRTAREAAASSQILQQRVELIRDHHWSQVAHAQTLAALLRNPADSEAELGDPGLVETMKVTVPLSTATGLQESTRSFSLSRRRGAVKVEVPGDFTAEPTLLFEGSIIWHDPSGVHERVLRTVVCRSGLTRGGIVGTVLGRPGTQLSPTP